MLKADLHLHAKEDEKWIRYSAKELIDRAAELKFDVLSFTFHNKLFYPNDLVNYANSKGILLIPGIELSIKKKHVLVYGFQEVNKIKRIDDLEREKNNLIIAAHPFFKTPTCLGKELISNIDFFDGIEYCHFYNHLFNFNKKAVEISRHFNKSLVGNSDCHILDLQLNKTYSLIDAEKNMNSIFDSIRKGMINVVSEPLPLSDIARISLKMRSLESFK